MSVDPDPAFTFTATDPAGLDKPTVLNVKPPAKPLRTRPSVGQYGRAQAHYAAREAKVLASAKRDAAILNRAEQLAHAAGVTVTSPADLAPYLDRPLSPRTAQSLGLAAG